MTTFAIATLGCKVNTYESQGYESALLAKGYQQAVSYTHLTLPTTPYV